MRCAMSITGIAARRKPEPLHSASEHSWAAASPFVFDRPARELELVEHPDHAHLGLDQAVVGVQPVSRQLGTVRSVRTAGQEIAAFTSSTTFFSTAGLHFLSAYDTGHMSPSSRFAASWKPRVE